MSPDGHNRDRTEKKKPEEVRPEAGVVKKLLKKVEEKLSGDEEVKASVADFIRLVQLQKELEEEQPREIKVTWVEPEESDSEK